MKIKNFLLLLVTFLSFAQLSNGQAAHWWPLKGNLNDSITGISAVAVDSGAGAAGISYVSDPVHGTVLKLDGSAYIKLPDSLFQSVSDFTITCWVKYDGYSASHKGHWEHVWSFGNKATAAWNIVYYTPNDNMGNSRFTFGSHGNWQDITKKDTAATAGNWDSISFVRKGSSLITYKNGVLYGRIDTLISAANNFKGSALFPDTINTIGQSYWADPLLHAQIADLRIYNEAITNMPTHWWPLKGNLTDVITGKTAVAVDSGAGAAGISYVTDPDKGEVLKLDGSAYVKLQDSLFQSISDFTITCLVKYDGYSASHKGHWEHVWSFGNKAAAAWNIVYYTPNDNMGNSRFTFGSHGNWQDITKKDTAATAGNWDSISFVRKGSTLITFKNGEIYGRIDTLISAVDNFKGSALYPDTINTIGQSYWADPLLHGLVADLRIYDVAISSGSDVVLATAVTVTGKDTLVKDSSTVLTATFTPTDVTTKTLIWTTSDKTVGAVSDPSIGKVKAKKAGTVVIKATTKDGSGIFGTKTIVVVNPPTAIKDASLSEFSILPNPASTEIRIRMNTTVDANIKIYSITGAEVMSKLSKATDEATLNIGQLAKGLYIVRVSTVNGTMAQKLIIK